MTSCSSTSQNRDFRGLKSRSSPLFHLLAYFLEMRDDVGKVGMAFQHLVSSLDVHLAFQFVELWQECLLYDVLELLVLLLCGDAEVRFRMATCSCTWR